MAGQDNADATRFDMGSADEIATCTSCHMGGGPYEVDRNGKRYDDFYGANKDQIAAGAFGKLNGDYFRYDIENTAASPFFFALDAMGAGPSPSLSAPRLHDWSESGVLEAECLTCHLDPFQKRLRSADGVDVQNYSPQMKVFVVAKMNAARDDYEDLLSVSFGRYPDPSEVPAGYEVFSAERYSSPFSGAFEPGRFYAASNSPGGTTRDAVKIPFVEGGKPDEAGGTNGFKMHNSYDPRVNVVTAANGDKVWGSRKFLGYYFRYAATGGLMGIDLDGNGVPLAYVKLVKKPGARLSDVPGKMQSYFEVKAYYDPNDLALFAKAEGTAAPILSSSDTGSQKWDMICARCHVAFRDPVNQGLYFRPDIMGMKADVPKRGAYWKMDYTGEAGYDALLQDVAAGKKSQGDLAGYDVHAAKGVTCVDCHATKGQGPSAPDHNFGKGLDTGGLVRDDLDFQKLKVCVDCHAQADMAAAHQAGFGGQAPLVQTHFDRVACETCHIPYKNYWAFRAFDYTVGGFAYNFDSRYMPNPADPGNVSQMLPFSAFSGFGIQDPQPGYYAAAPFYGIGGLQWVGQSLPTRGMDLVTSIAYFDPNGPDSLVAQKRLTEGQPADFLDPTRPMDPYAMFYTMMTDLDGYVDTSSPQAFAQTANGQSYFKFVPVLYKKADRDGKIKLYPSNPVAVATWVDYDPADPASMKILYARELNSILAGAVSREVMPGRHQVGIALINSGVTRDASGTITGYDPAKIVWDDNFDLRPEISGETELDLVKSALEMVLAKEDQYAGVAGKKHSLKLAMVAHYFTISHNVLPASQALGAAKDYDPLGGVDPATGAPIPPPGNVAAGKVRQCVDCHSAQDYQKYVAAGTWPASIASAGDLDLAANARLSNRKVTFFPWVIQKLKDLVAKGKVWIEPEVSYLHPMDMNGNGSTDDVTPDFSRVRPDNTGMVIPADLIGATQAEIIEGTTEQARTFARLSGLTPTDPAVAPAQTPAPAPAAGSSDKGGGWCFLRILSAP